MEARRTRSTLRRAETRKVTGGAPSLSVRFLNGQGGDFDFQSHTRTRAVTDAACHGGSSRASVTPKQTEVERPRLPLLDEELLLLRNVPFELGILQSKV